MNLKLLREIDKIFKTTIVYEGLQYGGKLRSVALLVKDLEILLRHGQRINKCRHFETNQDIAKLPRQIYGKLPNIHVKLVNSKKMVTEFYTHPFKT